MTVAWAEATERSHLRLYTKSKTAQYPGLQRTGMRFARQRYSTVTSIAFSTPTLHNSFS